MAEREKDAPKQPSHRAYTVIRREGQDDFWLNIGLAFQHADGRGLNIMLQAMPFDGKIVLREPSDDEADDRQSQKENVRDIKSGSRRR